MLKRKLFFGLERLKINRSERRAVMALMVILLSLIFVNILVDPNPSFNQSDYAEIKKVFNHRTVLLNQKHQKMMAAYKGLPVSVVESDTIPATEERYAGPVNINTASVRLLAKLPGIGPVYAQNIINYRKINGPFATKDELMKVRGIGEARLHKIKSLVVLGDVVSKTETISSEPGTLPEPEASTSRPKEEPVEAQHINVNTADAKLLETLPGIGNVYAQNIIQYRHENGSFTTFKELLKVKGIGKKRLAKLKPFIKLTGSSK